MMGNKNNNKITPEGVEVHRKAQGTGRVGGGEGERTVLVTFASGVRSNEHNPAPLLLSAGGSEGARGQALLRLEPLLASTT